MTGTSTRTFEERRIWRPTWSDIREAARLIAVAETAEQPDLIVAIRRGGIWPARIIAAQLEVPMTHVSASHNATDDPGMQGSGRVTVKMPTTYPFPDFARMLVVDEICGTGATFRAVIAALVDVARPGLIRTAALCRNTGSAFAPDRWAWDVADWVSFPWEPAPHGPLGTERLNAPTAIQGRS